MAEPQQRYQLGDCIGRGSYGDVFKGTDQVSGANVALKVIDLEDVEDDIEDIHKEIQMLAGCRCDNITQYYGCVLRPGSTELMIVMELMSCSVADLLHHGTLDEATISYIMKGVLSALAYLHAEHRIHRDIKAANILLSGSGQVKISDFGVSGQLTGTLGYRRRTFVGTPFWMAPEVIESSEEGYTATADIWSLGITAIEMATGAPPHAELHPMRVLFLIPKNPAPVLEGPFSAELKDFVAGCLQKDAASRPSALDLLKHPFIMRYCGADTGADAGPLSPPPGLVEMVAEYAKRRRPLVPRREQEAGSEFAAGGTLPGWDFGSRKMHAAAGGAGGGAGRMTLKMGDTLKAAVVDRYMSQTGGRSDTLTKGSAPLANGTFLAKRSASDDSAGSNDTRPLKDMAPAPLPPQPRKDEGESVIQLSGTVRVAHPATASAAALRYSAAAAQPQPSTSSADSGFDAGGTICITNGGSSMSSSGTTDPYGTVSSRAATVVMHGGTHKRSGTALQVEIANPATASPEKPLQPRGHQPATAGGASGGAALLGRTSREALAGESSAVLSRVLLPAVGALGDMASGDKAAAQVLASVQSALQQLEKLLPGASAHLLQEVMVRLATAGQPQLQPAKAAAASLLAGGSAGGPMEGPAATCSGRSVGGLGPLGEFLLGTWQEEVAHERALLARAQQLQ